MNKWMNKYKYKYIYIYIQYICIHADLLRNWVTLIRKTPRFRCISAFQYYLRMILSTKYVIFFTMWRNCKYYSVELYIIIIIKRNIDKRLSDIWKKKRQQTRMAYSKKCAFHWSILRNRDIFLRFNVFCWLRRTDFTAMFAWSLG